MNKPHLDFLSIEIRRQREEIQAKMRELEAQESRLRAELWTLQIACKHPNRVAVISAIGYTYVPSCPDCGY